MSRLHAGRHAPSSRLGGARLTRAKRGLAAAALAALTLSAGCELAPTNPYDPSAPSELQQAGRVVGWFVFPGGVGSAERLAADAGIVIRVLDATGRELTEADIEEGGSASVAYRPKAFVRDNPVPGLSEAELGGVAAPFDIAVPAGTYTLVFDPALNGFGGVLDEARVGPVRVAPGATVPTPGQGAPLTLAPQIVPRDQVPGFVGGTVQGVDGGDAVTVQLLPTDGDAPERTFTTSRTGPGAFSFSGVPSGTYRLRARGDGYAPLASTVYEVTTAAPRHENVVLQLASVGQLFSIANFSRDHLVDGAPAPWTESVPAPLPVAPYLPTDPDGQVRAYVSVAPQLMLGSGDLGEPTVRARVALASEFEGAAWQTVSTGLDQVAIDVGAPVEVATRGEGDGEVTIVAQLQVCFAGQYACDAANEDCSAFEPPLASRRFELQAVRDTQGPEAVEVRIEGAPLGETAVVNCADFGQPDCSLLAADAVFAPVIEATLMDRVGRAAAVVATLDDDAPPTSATLLSSMGPVVSTTASGVVLRADDPGAHTVRVWALDAAGNLGLLDTRDVWVDVAAVPLAAPGLAFAAGTRDGAVEGLQEAGTHIAVADAVVVQPTLGDTEAPAMVRVRETLGNVAVAGPATTGFVPYTPEGIPLSVAGAQRATFGLEVDLQDAAGNISTSSAALEGTVWHVGEFRAQFSREDAAGPGDTTSVVLQNADATVALTLTAPGTQVTAPGGGEDAPRATFGSDGVFAARRLPAGLWTVTFTPAPPHMPVSRVLEVPRGGVAQAGVVESSQSRGALRGQFLLAGREEDPTGNGGVQVTLIDAARRAVKATTTYPDGTWLLTDVVAGGGYQVVAVFPEHVTEAIEGAFVPADATGVVRPDGAGDPTPVVLAREVAGAFALCAADSPLLQATCDALEATGADDVHVGRVSFEGVTEYRVSTTAFEPGDAAPAWTPVVASGADFEAPVVNLSALGQGQHTVYLQLKSGTTPGDVQSTQIVYDTVAPTGHALSFARANGALLAGFTNVTTAQATVTADAPVLSGPPETIEAPLGDTCVVFASGAPATIPPGAVCARHGTTFTVPLDSNAQGLHTAYAFSCDQAGNCTAAPVSQSIVYDAVPPVLGGQGSALAPDLSAVAFDGLRWSVSQRSHDAHVVPGTSALAGPTGGQVPEVLGVQVGLEDAAAAAADVQAWNGAVDRTAAQVLRTPEYRGGVGEYEVFVYAVDAAGNRAAAPATYRLFYDNAPPRLSVTTPRAVTRDCEVSLRVRDLDGQDMVSIEVINAALALPDGTFRTLNAPLALPTSDTTLSFDLNGEDNDCDGLADGPYVLSVRAEDRAGNPSTADRVITRDTEPPLLAAPTCATCVGDGPFVSQTRSVLLDVLAHDAVGLSHIDVQVAGVTAAFAPGLPIEIQLPAGEGTHAVTVWAEDQAGNRSAPQAMQIVLDQTPPSVAITLDDAASTPARTKSQRVDVYVDAPDGTGMRLSNTGVFTGPFLAMGTVRDWTLGAPGVDGAKTVFVQVQDRAGLTASTSATIVLDQTAPTLAASVRQGALSSTQNVDVDLTITDGTRMCVTWAPGGPACDPADTTGSGWQAAASTTQLALGSDGDYVVTAYAGDDVHNITSVDVAVTVDTAAPTGVHLAFTNAGPVNSTAQTLNVDAEGATSICLVGPVVGASTDGCASNGWRPKVGTLDVTLTGMDGAKAVVLHARDDAGNTQTAAAATVELDRQAPTGVSLAIAGGQTYATDESVVLSVGVSGAAADHMMAIANGASLDCATANYGPLHTLESWPLPGADGLKSVSLCVRDKAGNTASATDAITLDRQAPVGSVTLAGGAMYTTSPTVTATIVTGDAVSYCVQGAAGGPSCDTPGTAVGSVSLTLAAAGQNTVTVGLFDAAGNRADVTDSIVLDADGPSVLSVAVAGGLTRQTAVSMQVQATGATEMRIGGDITDGFRDTWVAYNSTVALNLNATGGDGTKTVSVSVRDDAGNIASESATVLLDRAAPSIDQLTLDGGALYATDVDVALHVETMDGDGSIPVSGVAFVAHGLSPLDCDDASYEAYSPADDGVVKVSRNIALDGTDGAQTYVVCVKDNAGNVATSSASITLDRVDPDLSVTVAGGASHVNTRTVAVRVQGDGGPGYAFAPLPGDVACSSVADGDWLAFDGDESGNVTLPNSSQQHALYGCVREPSGRMARASGSVFLDLANPRLENLACADCATEGTALLTRAADRRVALTFAATDDESHVASLSLTVGGSTTSVPPTSPLTIQLPNADATHTVTVTPVDAAGNAGTPVGLSITLDRAAPTGGSVALTGLRRGCATAAPGCVNSAETAFPSVTATLSATGASTMRVSTSATFDGAPWVPFATSTEITVGPAEGTQTVYAQFRDGAGNVSAPVSDTINYDATAPSDPSLTLAGGAALTRSLSVSAALSATGATQMRIATDGNLNAATWIAYNTSRTITLPSGDGVKKVHVQFRDGAGNMTITSASIRLDRTAPVLSTVQLASGRADYASADVPLLVRQADGSDAVEMQVSVDGTLDTEPYVPYVEGSIATFAASSCAVVNCRVVRVRLRDAAGNVSSVLSDTVTVDLTAPSAPILTQATALTTSASVNVSFVAPVTETFFARYEIIGTGPSPERFTTLGTNRTTTSFTVSLNDGTSTDKNFALRIRAVDRAGNISAESALLVTRDLEEPERPTNLNLVAFSRGVRMEWTKSTSPDVIGYQVRYGYTQTTRNIPDADGAFALEGESPILVGDIDTFTLTGLPQDGDVYVQVRAIDGAGHHSPDPDVGFVPENERATGVTRPNPVTPELLAELDATDGVVWDSVRQGDLMYVAERCTHSEGGTPSPGSLEPDEQCTSNDGGLRVFSLADPENPVELAHCSAAGDSCGAPTPLRDVRSVVAKGHFVYVADGTQGVSVYDMRNPASPDEMYRCAHNDTCLPSGGSAWDLEVRGGNVYVADGPKGVQILDAKRENVLYSQYVRRCTGTTSSNCSLRNLSWASEYDADGRMGAWEQGTSLYNLASTNQRCSVRNIEVARTVVFATVASPNNNWCSLGDMTVKMLRTEDDKTDSVANGSGTASDVYPTAIEYWKDLPAFRPQAVRVFGQYVAVFDYDIHIYSLLHLAFGADPDDAKVLEIDDTGSWIDGRMLADGLIAIGRSNNVADAMKIFDLSSLSDAYTTHAGQPTHATTLREFARYGDASSGQLQLRNLHADGSMVLLSHGRSASNTSVQVLDLQTPSAVEEVYHADPVDVGYHITSVVKAFNNFVVTFGDDTLKLVDISDPQNPVVRDTETVEAGTTSRTADRIAIDWPYMYVAGADTGAGTRGVYVYDLTFPWAFSQRSYITVPGGSTSDAGMAVAVSGNLLFVGTSADGIYTFNVANPDNPYMYFRDGSNVAQGFYGTINTAGSPNPVRDLEVRGGYLYAALGCGAGCSDRGGWEVYSFPRDAYLSTTSTTRFPVQDSQVASEAVSDGPRGVYVWGSKVIGGNGARDKLIAGSTSPSAADLGSYAQVSNVLRWYDLNGWSVGGNGRTVYMTNARLTAFMDVTFDDANDLAFPGMVTELDMAGGAPIGPYAAFIGRGGKLKLFDMEY